MGYADAMFTILVIWVVASLPFAILVGKSIKEASLRDEVRQLVEETSALG